MVNKAEKLVARLAAEKASNPYYPAEEVYTHAVWEVNKKFSGKHFPPEYKAALTALRRKLGIWEFAK